MRRSLLLALLCSLFLGTFFGPPGVMVSRVHAQPTDPADSEGDSDAADDDEDWEEDDWDDLDDDDDDVSLRPPEVPRVDTGTPPDAGSDDPADGQDDPDDVGDDEDDESWGVDGSDEEDPLDEAEPGDDAALLESGSPSADPTASAWTSPQSVLTLHGYLRVRGELQDNFFLNRDGNNGAGNDWPFSLWVPASRGAPVIGNCTGPGVSGETGACGNDSRLRYANMRVRLSPTLAFSDDVRVHLTLDVLDNLVLGSTGDPVVPVAADGTFDANAARTPGAPNDFFVSTQNPPQAGNSTRDSIYVRRAWAEVTNRGLGQLRFGRMPHHWGLGMLYNSGDGLDDDFSTEVDRIQALTRFSDFFFGASWDFAGEGLIMAPLNDLRAVPFDFTQRDDVRQYSILAAYRQEPEEQERRLADGDWVLNAGMYFVIRNQSQSSSAIQLSTDEVIPSTAPTLTRRGARMFTPDIWVQFLMGGLRLEVEMAMQIGRINNVGETGFVADDYRILTFGFAFEGEYRLLDDKLGIHLDTGLASGDSQTRGLSNRENTYLQQDSNNRLTHFGFHPNYRVDLILFRNILGNVGGVWYLKPGVSYDIVRSAFGQRFGARVDFVYSRANRASQVYGDSQSLGIEIDASLYYRSDDGPGLTDGFYAAFQYGILIPMGGLEYRTGQISGGAPNIKNAQTLRLILGVEF